MNIKDQYIGISAIIIAIVFAVISQVTQNYLWLLPACIVLLAYIIFFFYNWYKLRAENEGKNKNVSIPTPGGGQLQFTGTDFLLVTISTLIFIFGIAALVNGNDPYQMYKDTLGFVSDIAKYIFNNTTVG